MLVTLPRRKGRNWFTLPPALLGALAVFLVSVIAWGQATPAAGPTTAPAGAAVAPASAAPDAGADAMKPDQSYWQLFQSGGWVMYILAGCSVIAVAIIFERIFSLRRSQVIPSGFLPGLKRVFNDSRDERQRMAALEYCRANDSPIARMVTAYIKRLPRGLESAEKALEDTGGNEALKLRSNMRFFYSIGSVATLLGLVGTIAGMIRAFMVTAKAGDAGNKVELLSTGIYQAMVCTFGGLAVAILVTLFYYFFVGRIEKLIGDINDELARFADEFGLNAESDAELGVTRPLLHTPIPGGPVAPSYGNAAVSGI